MDQATPDIESDLPDLTDLSLEELRSCDDGNLASTVRRVLERIDGGHGSISGYNGQRLR